METMNINTQHNSQNTHQGYHLTKRIQNGGAQPISEIVHIENWIVCCIDIY